MNVIAKNLPDIAGLATYNGQPGTVISMWRAATWCHVTVVVQFGDGRELTLSEGNFDASPEIMKIILKTRAKKSGTKPAALRRMQRNSARSAH